MLNTRKCFGNKMVVKMNVAQAERDCHLSYISTDCYNTLHMDKLIIYYYFNVLLLFIINVKHKEIFSKYNDCEKEKSELEV